MYNPMIMKRHVSVRLAVGFLILAGCSQPPAADTREADQKALREGEVAAFVKDWRGKDADRIAAHYADDGNAIIPNAPIMTGRTRSAKG